MNNKTLYLGLKNLVTSKNNILDTFLNYFCAFFKTPFSTHPQEMQIEPSAVCNLKCLMCTLNKSQNRNKFLTPKNLSIILEKFKVSSINLTGMGEILLNPYFEQLLKVCFEKNVKYSFITNIQLLNKKHLDAIKKYPPTSISISMESGLTYKYNSIRKGASLAITLNKIKELTNFINKNSLSTQIIINIVFLDFNLKDIRHIKKIIDLAFKLKINKITSQNINVMSPYIKKLYQTKKIKKIFTEIEQYSDSKNIEIILPSTIISSGKCYYPWVYPQVTATGEVLPCCIIPQFGDYDQIVKKYSFGNILNNPLIKIWNSAKAKSFRKNYQKNPLCRYCTKNQGVL